MFQALMKKPTPEMLARQREQEGMLDALNRSQAVIEFDLSGRILGANQNFLNAVGYSLEQIRGQHHAIFVDAATRQSPEYRAFWPVTIAHRPWLRACWPN